MTEQVMSRATAPVAARPTLLLVYRLIGIVVPLVAVIVLISQRPVSFDGAMNMQVAQSLADGGEYARSYRQELFPSDIQTSSYFLLIAAAAIRIFGATTLAFQASNIVFVAILLSAVSLVLPESRLAALLLPGTVLVATPGLLGYSMGGYGEGAVAALALCAFALLADAAVDKGHSTRSTVLAMACVGVAVSIKTVALAILPVALAALAIVWYANGRRWRPLLLGIAAAAGPVVAFEVYRAITLGNRYDDWWADQLTQVSLQATGQGLNEPSRPILAKIAHHFHILAVQTNVLAEWWLVLFLALPTALILTILVARRAALLGTLARPLILIACLTAYGLLYVGWWLAVTSTEKAWLRRVTVGLFALLLAAILLALLLAWMLRRTPMLRRPRQVALLAPAIISVIALVAVAVPSVAANKRTAQAQTQLESVTELSSEVTALADAGAEFYGIGWWSAPVISLYADVDVSNLGEVDYCEQDVLEVVEAGDAYIIWDFYAINLGSPEPIAYREVRYEETGIANQSGTLWRMTVPAGACD